MGEYMNFLFNPNGRISRQEIWLKYFLVLFGANIVASIIDTAIGATTFTPFSNLVALFFFWPGIAVAVKRFHDRGMTGWWVLIVNGILIAGFVLMFVPFWSLFMEEINNPGTVDSSAYENVLTSGGIGMFAVGTLIVLGAALFGFIVNYCLPGEPGPNKYGPDPLNLEAGHVDVFN